MSERMLSVQCSVLEMVTEKQRECEWKACNMVCGWYVCVCVCVCAHWLQALAYWTEDFEHHHEKQQQRVDKR